MDELIELDGGRWLRLDRIIFSDADGTVLAECTIIAQDGYDAYPVLARIHSGAVFIEEYQ